MRRRPVEVVCEHCGAHYGYDEQRHCWRCDGAVCGLCALPGKEPVCPECERDRLPRHLAPMLATMGRMPATQNGWAFEYKWDGVRALFYWNGKRHLVESRNLLNITGRYPELDDLGSALGERPAVLDGEIVALDERGRPSFGMLQRRMHLSLERVDRVARQVPAYYFVFDILFHNGIDLTGMPYADRRVLLEKLPLERKFVRLSPSHADRGRAMLTAAKRHGLEGLVAKRLDSKYEPGRRSPQWIKIKLALGQEFVVGGWTPEKNEGRIGSLLLGTYDGGLGLRYAGAVGTGFTESTHRMLLGKLRELERKTNPFADMPRKKQAHYVAPKLVVDVQYRRWPKDGQVQQASFKGLRTDKSPTSVTREEPV